LFWTTYFADMTWRLRIAEKIVKSANFCILSRRRCLYTVFAIFCIYLKHRVLIVFEALGTLKRIVKEKSLKTKNRSFAWNTDLYWNWISSKSAIKKQWQWINYKILKQALKYHKKFFTKKTNIWQRQNYNINSQKLLLNGLSLTFFFLHSDKNDIK